MIQEKKELKVYSIGNKMDGKRRLTFWLAAGLLAVMAVLTIASMSGASSAQASTLGQVKGQGEQGGDTGLVSEPVSPNGPLAVLYDQMNNASMYGVSSHISYVDSDYNDYAADDFIVPVGQSWTISQVEIQVDLPAGGSTIGYPNVYIYMDGGAGPGIQVYSIDQITPTSNQSNPHITLPINPHVSLPPGRYWLTVQGNLYPGGIGNWNWLARTTFSLYPGYWKNPGDGWDTGCVAWSYRHNCQGPLAIPLDHMFRLNGTIYSGATPTRTATRTPTRTPTSGGPTATPTATSQPSCPLQFTDVSQASTFYSYIRCLVCRGIVSGYADGTFRPGNDVTRGQIAKIVSNASGFSEAHSAQTFEDIPVNHTFYQYVERLASRGIIGGYACGGVGEPCGQSSKPYFRSNNNASRGQLAKIVCRAYNCSGSPVGQTFEDVAPNSTFYVEIEQLYWLGAINGYACGGAGEPCGAGNKPYFRPGGNVTRGQTAKIIANAFYPNCQTP